MNLIKLQKFESCWNELGISNQIINANVSNIDGITLENKDLEKKFISTVLFIATFHVKFLLLMMESLFLSMMNNFRMHIHQLPQLMKELLFVPMMNIQKMMKIKMKIMKIHYTDFDKYLIKFAYN